ncbi:MAG: hypothetical protein HQL95_05640 [Magnetococcales bacterium]|nr:hypothetical protein [Magnetococcales bacterium]
MSRTPMTQATVQGLLKNTDLLMDPHEIRAVVTSAQSGCRPLDLHAGRGRPVRQAVLADSREGHSLILAIQDPQVGNRDLTRGLQVSIRFHMGGYSLESRLDLLEILEDTRIRVAYPELFRVHSKRQASRYVVPMNMSCQVEMWAEQIVARGELQDVNLEGVSFLGESLSVPLSGNAAVRLCLTPASDGDPPLELTGILRFSGPEHQSGAAPRYRHSVQVTGAADMDAFRRYFGKISTSSHGWFRAAVISAESYRLTSVI